MSEILVIDDDRREGLAALLGAQYRHPSEVTEQEVSDADLIVIDQYLRDWTFVDGTPATMHPRGGLAVAAVLRSQLERSHTPFVIFTGALSDLGRFLPTEFRRPVLASAFGVEWVADRNDADLVMQLSQLATASRSLPTDWNQTKSISDGAIDWLGLSASAEWLDNALIDVQECHPATTGATTDDPGMVFIRWFLHEVLPYPTFLLNHSYSAIRIGITPEAFEQVLHDQSSPLGERVRAVRYLGYLNSFLGDRFWRAGLDWVLSASEAWGTGEYSDGEAAIEIHGGALDTLDERGWSVPRDGDLAELPPEPVENLTRILPEHWPAFADDAFALTDDIDTDDRLSDWRSRT